MDISVIIPTYNGEKTIERAINSIINQEGDYNIEVLICDDCSEDKTVKIAQELGAIVLKNKIHTGGPNTGRNLGIKKARGKYVAFLDQDDEWLKDKLQNQIKELENGYDFIYSSSITRQE